MNRKKKIRQILEKKDKKSRQKQNTSSKARYISKAERAKLTAEADTITPAGQPDTT